MVELRPIALTPDAFAPFGDIVAPGSGTALSINDGTAARHDDLARIDVGDGGGRPGASLFDATPHPTPVTVALVERHPLGSQLFQPLGAIPYLVVVAAGDPPFRPQDLTAFLIADGSGVNYRKGVWHMPLCALGRGGRFLVVDRLGPGANCEEFRFPEDDCAVVVVD